MPLPPPDTAREPLHTRTLRVNAFERDDGQWDLEAELIDVKAYDFPRKNGSVHRAGEPVHHILLRVTVSEDYTITAAVAAYEAAPFNQHCSSISTAYQGLVGMNLMKNFRQAVKLRFFRTAGCTHLTELSYVLPTVAIQARANRRRREEKDISVQGSDSGKRPFQLEGCHALRLDGEPVREFYPQWYKAPVSGGQTR
jgi:hypothetical protein